MGIKIGREKAPKVLEIKDNGKGRVRYVVAKEAPVEEVMEETVESAAEETPIATVEENHTAEVVSQPAGEVKKVKKGRKPKK